jgi:hypothetical protein
MLREIEMFFIRLRSVVVILLLMLLAVGCLRVPPPAATISSESTVKRFAEFNLGEFDASKLDSVKLDSAKLVDSTRVANQALPLKPQLPSTYTGKTGAENVQVMDENCEDEPEPQELSFSMPSVVNLCVVLPVDGKKTQAVFGLVVYRLSIC